MQKNFVLFIVISAAILAGWMMLQPMLFPPRQPDPNKVAKKDPPNKVEDKADLEKKEEKKDEKKEEKKETKPPEVGVKPPEKKPADKPEVTSKREPEPETITLGGGKTHHLQVKLTTKGAGVQQVILNRFKAANYLGEPVDRPLELVQEDPFLPSYLMYHYADTAAEHPVFPLGEKTWTLEGKKETLAGDVEEVKFWARVPGQEDVKVTKTYRLGPRDYHVSLILEFERDQPGGAAKGGDAKQHKFKYQLTGAHGLPVEGEWYTSVFRNSLIGMVDGRNNLDRALEDAFHVAHKDGGDKVPAGDRGGSMLQYAGVATQYFAAMIVVADVQPMKDVDPRSILKWARPTLETSERRGKIVDVSETMITLRSEPAKVHRYQLLPHVHRHIVEAKLKAGDQVVLSHYESPEGDQVATWVRRGQAPRSYLDDITVRVVSEEIELSPGSKVAHEFLLYHGPVKVRQLTQFSGDESVPSELIDRYTDKLHLATLTDYGSVGFFRSIGWSSVLIWTTKVMHSLLHLLSYIAFGNYGLSIILMTVLVRGLMFPITKKQALFSIRMQELQPEMKKIQEKYKNDPQGRMQATRELQRKHDINPLAGCLPLLMQMPIFLGLYYALQESIQFRLAGFLWMDNLAAPDMLVWWGEGIPLISDPDNQSGSMWSILYLGPYLNVLPIFAVALMFVQQKMMTPPAMDEQQAIQQKTFQFMMIFMGLVFYKVASGLCIYFIASSLWGVAERKLLPKKKTGEPLVAVSPNGKATPARGKGKAPPMPTSNGAWQRVKNWWTELLKSAEKK